MNKFNLGDKIFYLYMDYYLEECRAMCGLKNDTSESRKHPFTINAIKNVKEQNIYTGEVAEQIVYDCYYEDDCGRLHVEQEIPEEYIFFDFDKAKEHAINITNTTRWH